MDNYKGKESLSRVVMNQTFEDMKEIVRKNPFAQHIGMELLEVTNYRTHINNSSCSLS